MKGNKKQIFLVGLYPVLLSCLIVLQYCYIDGTISRLLSNGVALILIVSCALLMREWKNTAAADDEGNESAAGNSSVVCKTALTIRK